MVIGAIFKFSQYMHINVRNKIMHNSHLFVTSLKIKRQIIKSQRFFVQNKALEPLMLET